MDFSEQPANEEEISDLQTAKIALHGALAMMRNLQDLTNRLKGELQDAHSREKMATQKAVEAEALTAKMQSELEGVKFAQKAFETGLKEKLLFEVERDERLRWERHIQDLNQTISELQTTRKRRSEELQRAKTELTKKEGIIADLLSENSSMKLHSHEELTQAIVRLENERDKAIQEFAAADQIAVERMKREWSERVHKLQKQCAELELTLAEKEALLELPFNERNQQIAVQRAVREQELWKETQKTREDVEAEIVQRYDQRLALASAEHEQIIAALKKQLADQLEEAHQKILVVQRTAEDEERIRRALYEQKESEFRMMINDAMHARESELSEKEKNLRLELQQSIAAEREAITIDRRRHLDEADALKAALRMEFELKEKELRERFRAEEQAMDDKAREKERLILEQMSVEREAQEKLHDLTLQQQLKALSSKHQDILKANEIEILQLRTAKTQAEAQGAAFKDQLSKREAERAKTAQEIMTLNLEVSRLITDAKLSSKSQLEELEARHKIALKELAAEVEKRDRHIKDLQTYSGDQKRDEAALKAENERLQAQFKAFQEESAQKWADLRKKNAELEERQSQLSSAEEQCATLQDQLSAALRRSESFGSKGDAAIVDDWIFGFAHQIRNPLAIIRSTAESLATSQQTQAIIESADGLAARLNQFMQFSKPMEPSFQPVRMADVLTQAIVSVHERFARSSIQIKRVGEERIPPIPGNEDQLQQAFVQILLNAQEAMPRGGKVEVVARHDPQTEQIVISIQDSGPGVRADHLTEIGKPFFSTKVGHAGLGLAQVKRILHLYSGELKIENRTGGGLQVRCIFHRKGRGA